jgi:ferredoxin
MIKKIYYFSGTGNSYYVAKRIAAEIDAELVNMAEVIGEENQFTGDVVGFVFPVYAMGIPQMVGKFITNLEIKGNPYIFSVASCGGSGYGVPFNLIDSILKDKRVKGEKALKLNYSGYVQFPDSYLKMFNPPNREDSIEKIKVSDIRLEVKISDIKEKRENKYTGLLLNPVFKLIYMAWLKNLYKADKKFVVKESCVGCNLCSEICPSNNIAMIDAKPTWNSKCQDCMGCINVCPVRAIELGAKTEKKRRYINPMISPNELKVKGR